MTLSGCAQEAALSGGENLSGGEAAKGMPRNLLTVAVAWGSWVVVPSRTPDATVAVGRQSTRET